MPRWAKDKLSSGDSCEECRTRRVLSLCPSQPPVPSIRLASTLLFPPAAASRAVHPTPIASIAPASSSSDPPPSLERHIGELVAGLASAIALGLEERFRGSGLSSATKWEAAELLTKLFRLKQFLAGRPWDFDAIARQHGAILLRESCGGRLSSDMIDRLIVEALDLLSQVVKSAAN